MGGLTTAHGSFIGRRWEASVGLFLIIIGALLLFIKVDRRNRPYLRIALTGRTLHSGVCQHLGRPWKADFKRVWRRLLN